MGVVTDDGGAYTAGAHPAGADHEAGAHRGGCGPAGRSDRTAGGDIGSGARGEAEWMRDCGDDGADGAGCAWWRAPAPAEARGGDEDRGGCGWEVSGTFNPPAGDASADCVGSLIQFYPNYERSMRESLRMLIGEETERRIDIGMAKDGSGVGGWWFRSSAISILTICLTNSCALCAASVEAGRAPCEQRRNISVKSSARGSYL